MASAPASVPASRGFQYSDLIMAVAVIVIIGLMVIPLPTFLLDILIAINITVALAVLLVSMYTKEPLEFSVFPALLLVVTLFRLGLNVAATRLILLQGDAGTVIESFAMAARRPFAD